MEGLKSLPQLHTELSPFWETNGDIKMWSYILQVVLKHKFNSTQNRTLGPYYVVL